MNIEEAQKILSHPLGFEEAPLSFRLRAHAVVLRASEDTLHTQFRLAEALADICIALTRIGAR